MQGRGAERGRLLARWLRLRGADWHERSGAGDSCITVPPLLPLPLPPPLLPPLLLLLLRGWPVAPSLALIVCGAVVRLVRELMAAAAVKGPGHPLGCRVYRLNSPLAQIAPSQLLSVSARLGNGFLQPWVIWSISSFNRLGHP